MIMIRRCIQLMLYLNENSRMISEKLLIVPCFNEELRWNWKYWNKLAGLPYLQLLFVNDGSSDKTAELINSICREHHSVSSLSLNSNSGKAEAIRQGLQFSLSGINQNIAWFGFLDADGCIPFEEVSRILEITDIISSPGTDALWTSRLRLSGHNIERKIVRHLVGRLIAGIVSLGRPGLPRDTQCGFKLFRNSLDSLRIFQEPFLTRWLFELEIIERWGALKGQTLIIHEEPLKFWRDIPGSKITLRQFPRVLKEIAQIKILQLFS